MTFPLETGICFLRSTARFACEVLGGRPAGKAFASRAALPRLAQLGIFGTLRAAKRVSRSIIFKLLPLERHRRLGQPGGSAEVCGESLVHNVPETNFQAGYDGHQPPVEAQRLLVKIDGRGGRACQQLQWGEALR